MGPAALIAKLRTTCASCGITEPAGSAIWPVFDGDSKRSFMHPACAKLHLEALGQPFVPPVRTLTALWE